MHITVLSLITVKQIKNEKQKAYSSTSAVAAEMKSTSQDLITVIICL